MKNHGEMCVARGKIIVIHVLAGILMALVFGLLFGYFVMLLWNSLLPDIFGAKEITYWQGAGLVILFRLLFGAHGYRGHGRHSGRFPMHGRSRSCGRPDSDYSAWWEQEGKAAFQQYVHNKKEL